MCIPILACAEICDQRAILVEEKHTFKENERRYEVIILQTEGDIQTTSHAG
jgi:formate hydrogenlyase subunit 6/NADH:ubiquinone oxidoreductase subunit I